MKKITTIAVVACMTVSFASCSKSSSVDLTGAQQPANQVTAPSPEVKIISGWVNPTYFNQEVDRSGRILIKGYYPFAATQPSYDESNHVELAYLRIPLDSRIPYRYEKLPAKVSVDMNGVPTDVLMDQSIDTDGLKIYYRNADLNALSRAADLSASGNWKFIYIVIPKTTYDATHINWDDLKAVATALNFSL